MGATLFFGLTFATLITQGPVDVVYENPNETMADTEFQSVPTKVPYVGHVAWILPVNFDDVGPKRSLPGALSLPAPATEVAKPAPPPAPPLSPPGRPQIVVAELAPPFEEPIDLSLPGQDAQIIASRLTSLAALSADIRPAAPETATKPLQPPQTRLADWAVPNADTLDAETAGLDISAPVLPMPAPSPRHLENPALQDAAANADKNPISAPETLATMADQQIPQIAGLDLTVLAAPLATSLVQPAIPPFAQPSGAAPQNTWAELPARVKGDAVPLFQSPNPASQRIASFEDGAYALILETRAPWHRIRVEGRVGWMRQQNLSPTQK